MRLRATAEAAGLSPRTVQRRARAEGWWWPFPDVVAPPGVMIDATAWCRAAILHADVGNGDRNDGGGSVAITRRHALHLHGVRATTPTRVSLLVPATRRVRHRPGLEVVRTRHLDASDVVRRFGVPVVGGTRLPRDLAAVCDVPELRAIVIDLVQRGLTGLPRLLAGLQEQASFPGRGRLRRVLAELEAVGGADSPLELAIRTRLAADAVPLDRGQVAVPVAGGRTLQVDLGISAIRFGIEVESMLAHSQREHLEVDVLRSNAVVTATDGWQVLRATWTTLEHGWPTFVEQVRGVVAAQSREHLGLDWPLPEHLRA